MSLAANAPRSFALVDLDSECALERSRFKDATAAAMKAIKLRKQDGRVREVVGIDAAGHPCRIELGSTRMTRENMTGYVLAGRIGTRSRAA